jgi:diacylglycerol kinase family enzyme
MTRKAGVLINPTAGRGNGKGLRLAAALSGAAGVELRLLESFEQLQGHLEDMARAGVTDLFISSGDGTIQAVQTLIVENRIFQTLPRLCLLPHGTTNLTGLDVGFRVKSITRQAQFIRALPQPHLLRRHSLRVANPRDGQPRHGMTLGAGAAARGTRHAQLAFNDKGIKGPLANFATIAGGLAKAALGTAKADDAQRLDRPCPMEIRHEGTLIAEGPQLLFVATTLHHLFFRTKPFWGGKRGPLRATVIPHPTPNVLRWALPLMYGGELRKVPKGAHSFSGSGLEIRCDESYVMDGEFFDGPEIGLLEVSAGPEFEFIRG